LHALRSLHAPLHRQQQLRAAREEHAATRLHLEEIQRASREQQGHVVMQLQELEGCSAEGGEGSEGGHSGGLCVVDLHRQLKVGLGLVA
jgi:hypothetical protein